MTSACSRLCAPLLGIALLFSISACDGTASVTFSTGPQRFEFSTTQLMLPTQLRDGTQVASVPCVMGMCPSGGGVTISCQAGTCNPDPYRLSVPIGGTLDIDTVTSGVREVVAHVDEYQILSIDYTVELNTMTVDIGAIDTYWGPEGANAVDPNQGVRLLGTVPSLPAGTTPTGTVAIDASGSAMLSSHLVNVSPRLRFFAETSVDLEPGDTFPEGSVRVTVNLTIRASGSLLR